jgi:predicted nuclease of predicted toxin-antitoxin system
MIEGLRKRGWDVMHATEEFGEKTRDAPLFDYAAQTERVLVSTDADMLAEAKVWLEQGRAFRLIWWKQKKTQRVRTSIVLLSCGRAEEALRWTQRVVGAIGLSLNETKTCIRDARHERFDFLGYSFGSDWYPRHGNWYLSAKPSKKSLMRVKQHIRSRLRPGNHAPWPAVAAQVNHVIRGWSGYFNYGTRSTAYHRVNQYVDQTARHFLRRRHKVHTRGTRQFRSSRIFGALGIVRLGLSTRPSPT